MDAETSEVHPALSDGQRAYDLDVLVENVAFGLADLAAFQGRPETMDEQIDAAEAVRTRYTQLWEELFRQVEIQPGDRFAISAHVRRLNDLGFAVGEIELEPGANGRVRLRAAVTRRDFHARELQRRTGLDALEGQARLLLNDLREYRAWLEYDEQRRVASGEASDRWRAEVLVPALGRLAPAIGPTRDALQAYCDLLEHKWLLSERRHRDVGLETALDVVPGGRRAGAGGPGRRRDARRRGRGGPRGPAGPRLAGLSRGGPAARRGGATSAPRGRSRSSVLRPPARFGAVRSAGSAGIAEREDELAVPVGRVAQELARPVVLVDGGRDAADPELPGREDHALGRPAQVPA